MVVGETVKAQPPGCVTVTVCPAIVMVPVRGVAVGLAAAVNATVPFPDPLAPLVIVIHGTPDVAVQAHPAVAVTVVVPVPPPAGTVMVFGETV
jgi:hypothetical protein